jgi:hypothetical protein
MIVGLHHADGVVHEVAGTLSTCCKYMLMKKTTVVAGVNEKDLVFELVFPQQHLL